ncbi:NUMOD1 domain-containing DNA-binding protein [Streptomyces fungicidicus]|uniref:NUMOD1 domain-containing DNA-binding protein n=1 Tax=Streptomyces fungicidicus TaxID=68203 RepID=UPI003D715CBB
MVVVTNVLTKETVIYNSVSDAARSLNVNRFTLSRRIKDKHLLDGVYKFSNLY